MSNEKLAMSKVNRQSARTIAEGNMKAINNKTCVDCLYCKVSAQSLNECIFCFCSQTGRKEKEFFWLNKKACPDFNDMSDDHRRPLLRKRS